MLLPRFTSLRGPLSRLLPFIDLGRRSGDDPVDSCRQRYRDAVDALPPEQRTVFTLHRVHDLSITEIADRLEMNAAEVEQHLAAALLMIMRAINGPGDHLRSPQP